MRILQIANYIYPDLGGVGQVARDIANSLSGEKIQQKIICFNSDAQNEEYVTHWYETTKDAVDGIEVIRCSCLLKIFSQSISLSFRDELKKLMEDFCPDIVIFHYPNPFMVFFLSKYYKQNFKLVIFWHSDIVKQRLLGKLFNGQTKNLLLRANAVVAASPNYVIGSKWLRTFKDKVFVIPDAAGRISQSACVNASHIVENLSAGGEIILFALGRHVPYKGFEYLIRASRLLDNRFEIFIGGKGKLTSKLKHMAKADKKIKFVGQLTDAEMEMYYQKCDIFCFPSVSKNEGFGIALARALAYGKPCVTFNIPGSGVNYVNIDGLTGIECPNRDVVAYANAIKRLADDASLREFCGKNAMERAKLFSPDCFRENVLKMLKNVDSGFW